MIRRRHSIIFALPLLIAFSTAWAQERKPASAPDVMTDIERTLGFVPQYLRDFPPELLPGAWADMKAMLMGKTSLAPKHKELIGLAVSAQVPCDYCAYYHTRAAEAAGAKTNEIREAVAVAALTRKWGTIAGAMLGDEQEFRGEVKRMHEHLKKMGARPSMVEPITDAASAYRDIERTYGFVPGFLRAYPREAIAGAWRELRMLHVGETALPPKIKGLIVASVGAQIPCSQCVIWGTEEARAAGATDQEISEAMALSSMVRHWSTWLNGMQLDHDVWRRDVDRIFNKGKRAPQR